MKTVREIMQREVVAVSGEATLAEPLASYGRQTGLKPGWDRMESGEGALIVRPAGERELVREWLRGRA